MNASFQRSLVAVAGERIRDHPADAEQALQRGMDRYRRRIRLAYGAIAAAAVLVAGLLFMAHHFAREASKPTDITFASYELALPLNTPAQLHVDGVYKDGTRPLPAGSVTWTSDRPDVASVGSASGEITGLSPGEAAITASAYGLTKQIRVTVTKAKLESIDVKGPGKVEQGREGSFTAEGKFSDGTTGTPASVTWKSGKPAIATVDSTTGKVTGVSPGKATITASADGKEGSRDIVVTPAATQTSSTTPSGTEHRTLVRITIDGPDTVTVGATERYTATGVYSDDTRSPLKDSVTWTSSDQAIATVDSHSGEVTGVRPGPVDVTAHYGGVASEPKRISVAAAPPTCTPPAIVEAAYIGRPVDEVRAKLTDLGLHPVLEGQVDEQAEANTVLKVIPTCTDDRPQVTIVYSLGPTPSPTPVPSPTAP